MQPDVKCHHITLNSVYTRLLNVWSVSLHHARCQCVSNPYPRPPGTSLTWQRGRGAKETRVHRNACKYWSRPAAVCQSASPHNKQVKVCWAHAQVCEQSPVSVAGLCRGGLGPGHPGPGASGECNQSVRGCHGERMATQGWCLASLWPLAAGQINNKHIWGGLLSPRVRHLWVGDVIRDWSDKTLSCRHRDNTMSVTSLSQCQWAREL